MKRNAAKHAIGEPRLGQPINPADLDDELVKSVEETVSQVLLWSTRPVSSAKEKEESREEKLWRDNLWTAAHKLLDRTTKLPRGWRTVEIVAGWAIGLSAPALFIGFLALIATQGDIGWRAALYPLFTLLIGWAGAYIVGKYDARRKKAQTFVPETLTKILPIIEPQTALDGAYTASVAALMPHADVWGNAATQTHLRDLNDLLMQGREAAARRAEIDQAVTRQSVQTTETEAEKLVARLEQIHDTEARAVFTQSLAHLEGRKSRLQNVEPLRERLEARETAIIEALREAQVTLADAQFMGIQQETAAATGPFIVGESGKALPAPWTNTVSRIRRQTVSVETALQEVAGAVRAASV